MVALRRLAVLGILCVLATLSLAGAAEAAWIEVGPTPAPRVWSPPPPTPHPYPTPDPYPYPTPPPPPIDSHGRVVRDFLGGLSLGTPYGWEGLTIVPVHASSTPRGSTMRTLEQAMRGGYFHVREYGSGSVPTIEVENRSATPVFLLAGEIILGGKQDRVIRDDTVIGPYSGPVQVPVYCVEQGRWAPSASRFEAAPHAIADRDLRSKAAAGAGQDEIWSHVARKSESAGVRSPTSSYGDVVANPEVSRRLDEYVARCPLPSRRRTVGAVFLSGGEVLGVDLFGDPSLMSALWPKLVRSYAAQAMGYGRVRHHEAGSASAALAALRGAWPSFAGWAGSAPRLSLSVPGFDASAVAYDGGVVHVVSLPGHRYYEPPPPPPPPYDPYER